jgi:hypothetical protein
MGENWNGLPPPLWAWVPVLLLYALERLLRYDAHRARSILPLLLLLGGICLHSRLGELAQRCQATLFISPPVRLFDQALRLPPS